MITDRQLLALKELIQGSKEGSQTLKKLLLFMIRNSQRLTEPVHLSLWQDREGYSARDIRSIVRQLSIMLNDPGSTHLNQLMALIGTHLIFSSHTGVYGENGEPGLLTSSKLPVRYTFWLATEPHGQSGPGRALVATRQEIESIDFLMI